MNENKKIVTRMCAHGWNASSEAEVWEGGKRQRKEKITQTFLTFLTLFFVNMDFFIAIEMVL
jgi:hypothetical protein